MNMHELYFKTLAFSIWAEIFQKKTTQLWDTVIPSVRFDTQEATIWSTDKGIGKGVFVLYLRYVTYAAIIYHTIAHSYFEELEDLVIQMKVCLIPEAGKLIISFVRVSRRFGHSIETASQFWKLER